MALLPQQVGSVTLTRATSSDGVTESYIGILDEPAGQQVVVRKVQSGIARDDARMTSLRSRIADLLPLRHANLLATLDHFEHDGALYIVEEWVDAVTLADVVAWCREHDTSIPHNVFLDLSVQICNGLEAMHNLPGVVSGSPHVLHLSVRPQSIFVTRDGEVRLGEPGLVRSPTLAPHSGGIRMKQAYLSPEQTTQGQTLDPASDLFSLGAVLYELLLLKPMFTAATPLRTIAKVRKAEVTTELLEIKEIFTGLDRVLYRALSRNQRHRYPHAFVLRGDLRGLMAGYSFTDIRAESRAFLAPLFQGQTRAIDEVQTPVPADHSEGSDAVVARLEDFDFGEIHRTEEIELPTVSVEPMGLTMATATALSGAVEPTAPVEARAVATLLDTTPPPPRPHLGDTLDPTPIPQHRTLPMQHQAATPRFPLVLGAVGLLAALCLALMAYLLAM